MTRNRFLFQCYLPAEGKVNTVYSRVTGMGNVGCVSCEVTEKLQVVVVAVLFAILTCLVYCLPPARLTGVPSVGKTCCCCCCCRTVVRTWYLASPVQAGEGYIMTLGGIAQINIPPLSKHHDNVHFWF